MVLIPEESRMIPVGQPSDRDFLEIAREEYMIAGDYWSSWDRDRADFFHGSFPHMEEMPYGLDYLPKPKTVVFVHGGKQPQEVEPPLYAKPPLLYSQDELEHIFRVNADKWYEETGMMAFVADRIMHPAYLRVIGLGRQVIPLILGELQESPDHWFWALRAIAGEDPVESESDFDEAVEAWLRWGRQAGYVG